MGNVKFIALLACLIAGPDSFGQGTSLDTWTTQVSGTTNNLNAVIYHAGNFMAAASGGVVLISPDGTNWTSQSVGATNNLYGLIYSTNGLYVAVGAKAIFTSTDGVNWTNQATLLPAAYFLSGIGEGDGLLVAVGQGGALLTSANAINWITRSSGTSASLFAAACGNGRYVAAGAGAPIYSTNGINWSNAKAGFVRGLAFANGIFVGVGGDAPATIGGYIATSPDGSAWSIQQSGISAQNFAAITQGNGFYLALGGFTFGPPNSTVILSSPDAVHWTAHPESSSNQLNGVAYGNGSFVAVGNGGTILQSGPVFTISGGSQITQAGYALTLTGQIGRSYSILANGDLTATNWPVVANFTNTTETTQFLDSGATRTNQRFYRAVTP
jgi:hypothetical protein